MPESSNPKPLSSSAMGTFKFLDTMSQEADRMTRMSETFKLAASKFSSPTRPFSAVLEASSARAALVSNAITTLPSYTSSITNVLGTNNAKSVLAGITTKFGTDLAKAMVSPSISKSLGVEFLKDGITESLRTAATRGVVGSIGSTQVARSFGSVMTGWTGTREMFSSAAKVAPVLSVPTEDYERGRIAAIHLPPHPEVEILREVRDEMRSGSALNDRMLRINVRMLRITVISVIVAVAAIAVAIIK